MKAGDFMLGENYYSDMYYFLQVVKATAKTVTLRRVRNVNGVPVRDRFVNDEVLTRRVNDEGKVSLGNWSSATPWSGEPFHSEHPVWGVNYNLY